MQPHSYNTDTERLDSQRVKSVTTMGWTNYKKPGYSWDKISNLILPDGTVTKQNLSVQLPGSSQGWMDILFDSQFSTIRRSIDGRRENNEPALELSVCVETQHNVTGTIDPNNPNVMLYSDAWDGADLRIGTFSGMRPRLNKIVVIKAMPAGDGEYVEYSFLMRSNKAKATVESARPWNGNVGEHFSLIGQEAFIARGDSQIRGCFLGTPKCWWHTTDEDGEEMVETRDIELHCTVLSDGETVRATKKIPRAYIQQAISDGSHLFTDETFNTDKGNSGRDFWTHRKAGENAFISVGTGQTYADMMGEDSYGSGGSGGQKKTLVYAYQGPCFHGSRGSYYSRVTIKGFYFDTSELTGFVDTSATSKLEIPIYNNASAGTYSEVNIFSSKDLGGDEWEVDDPTLFYLPNSQRKKFYSSIFDSSKNSHLGHTALSTARIAKDLNSHETNVNDSYNDFVLNSAGESNINKNGYTRILMTFSNWDSRVGGSESVWMGGNFKHFLYCWHPDHSSNVGAKLTTVFKQAINPGAFWLMG